MNQTPLHETAAAAVTRLRNLFGEDPAPVVRTIFAACGFDAALRNAHDVERWTTACDAISDAILTARDRNTKNVKTSAIDVQVGGEHYKQFAIQPGVFCETNKLTFFESDVIKRLCRHSRGGKGLQDLEKAMHELKLIAKVQYGVDL